MPIDPDRLLSHRFEPIRQSYAQRDTILYALGVGLGRDPLDERDLDYLIETRGKVLPTFAVTLASPGMWIRDPAFGVDFARLVHVEQEATFASPLPPSASVIATPRVASLHDRGAGRGAVVVVERVVSDEATGVQYATVKQTLLLRGDGGFGGEPPPAGAQEAARDGEPDFKVEVPISHRAALIYRLSGDWNPLHADPGFARDAGFAKPILHGLATYGLAGWAVGSATPQADADPRALPASLSCRFTGVVHPGDKLTFSCWVDGTNVAFEAHADGRRVLDRGRLVLR